MQQLNGWIWWTLKFCANLFQIPYSQEKTLTIWATNMVIPIYTPTLVLVCGSINTCRQWQHSNHSIPNHLHSFTQIWYTQVVIRCLYTVNLPMLPLFPGCVFFSNSLNFSHDPPQRSITFSRVREPFLKLKVKDLSCNY